MSISRALGFLLLNLVFASSGADDLKLEIRSRGNAAEISSTEINNSTVTIEKSHDLQNWQNLALFEWQAVRYSQRRTGQRLLLGTIFFSPEAGPRSEA